VRGDLAPAERDDFERNFLCTGERRGKLEFARALHAHVAGRRALRERPWDWLRRPITAPGWALATAAALLLMLPALAWQLASTPRVTSDVEATLAAGLVRDATGALSRVRLTRDCQLVHLDLEPGPGAYPAYRATLHEVTGDELWSQDKLRPAPVAGKAAITLTLPCELLPPEDYYIRLLGVSPGADPVPLERYDFRVLRP
jgi:hypothetical protein